MNFQQRLREDAALVNHKLTEYIPAGPCLQQPLLDAMQYSLMGGGKRIRPVLTLEFCRACGGDPLAALPLACAVEMVHTYSLIHDDLPCMDNDDMRRGRPSCHKQFSEDIALLAGDALLSLAFETIAGSGLAADKTAEAVQVLARASGPLGMVGGQVIDLQSEGKRVDAETLNALHSGKTVAMIAAAAQLGCIAAGASAQQRKAASVYAEKIGLVFQVVDDILDVTSTEEKLGKPIGSDRENEKTTYATLYGLEESQRIAAGLTEEAKRAVAGSFAKQGEFLKELADFLCQRDY